MYALFKVHHNGKSVKSILKQGDEMDSKNYSSLYEMPEAFPTEESCVRHLEKLRWPDGGVGVRGVVIWG